MQCRRGSLARFLLLLLLLLRLLLLLLLMLMRPVKARVQRVASLRHRPRPQLARRAPLGGR